MRNFSATINGIRYDTATAVEVCRFASSAFIDYVRPASVMMPLGGPHEMLAVLYRTPKSGRYFIHGNGGALTCFRGKERIIPLSKEEAEAFMYHYQKEVE